MKEAAVQVSMLDSLARRVGVFALTFVAGLFACPLLAMAIHRVLPRVVGNFLFFWPQLALAPFGFTHPSSDQTRTYLGGGWNYVVTGLFWLLVGVALGWVLRRKAVRITSYVTLPVSFAIAIAAAAILDRLDVGIYFEGP
jgi:hypothetical protein